MRIGKSTSIGRNLALYGTSMGSNMERKQQRIVIFAILAVIVTYSLYAILSKRSTFDAEDRWTSPYSGPMKTPRTTYTPFSTDYTFAIVADMDHDSKRENDWMSIFKTGVLHRNSVTGNYSVSWKSETILSSKFNEGGRGMELSALVYFNGRLLAFDDRTGLVMDIQDDKVVPVVILMNGDGNRDKGFKTEWATVKGDKLYVGSMGKEWTDNNGVIQNQDPQWIKVIDSQWRVEHISWVDNYSKLRQHTHTNHPGYLLHEAVTWNEAQKRWYFLPRRVSKFSYNEVEDETRGSNLVLSCTEDFQDITTFRVGRLTRTHGFSAFKFIPHREHEVVALKTEEYRGVIHTYIMVFSLDGRVLMDETPVPSEATGVSDTKYEGIEFI